MSVLLAAGSSGARPRSVFLKSASNWPVVWACECEGKNMDEAGMAAATGCWRACGTRPALHRAVSAHPGVRLANLQQEQED